MENDGCRPELPPWWANARARLVNTDGEPTLVGEELQEEISRELVLIVIATTASD